MWTVGASGPREILAQTPQQVPTNFTSRVLHELHHVMDMPCSIGVLNTEGIFTACRMSSCESAWTKADLKVSKSGMLLPFKYAMMRDTPAPLATGAQYCTCKQGGVMKDSLQL